MLQKRKYLKHGDIIEARGITLLKVIKTEDGQTDFELYDSSGTDLYRFDQMTEKSHIVDFGWGLPVGDPNLGAPFYIPDHPEG